MQQLPEAGEAGPLFEAPWQARIFALIVSLVKEGHLPWKAFQAHLVGAISEHHDTDQQIATASLEGDYFQNWLIAVEKTLKDLDFMNEGDLTRKIAELQSSTTRTRELQLQQRGTPG